VECSDCSTSFFSARELQESVRGLCDGATGEALDLCCCVEDDCSGCFVFTESLEGWMSAFNACKEVEVSAAH